MRIALRSPHDAAMHSTHTDMSHGVRCGQRMFTKQVSRPVDSLDPSIVAPEAEQVERTRRKTWSRSRSEVFVPPPFVLQSQEQACELRLSSKTRAHWLCDATGA